MPVFDDTWSVPAEVQTSAYSGRIRGWYRTPGYGSLPKDEKPVNPYSCDQISGTQQRFTQGYMPIGTDTWFYSHNNVYLTAGNGLRGSMPYWATARTDWDAWPSRVENEVKVKALVKMADAKVNVAVAYAEARKTSDLIFDTARRIDRAYRAFRRGNLREVARQLNITPGRVHKTWLEYKYGWMPLLMDVKGAAEFFAQQHVVRPPRFKVSAVEAVNKIYNWTENNPTYGGGGPTPQSHTLGCEYKVRIVYWCELSFPHLAELQQIGLTNPALVAWELIPFSFVFDWFIQVGDWLTAMTAQNGVTIRRTCWSTLLAQTWSCSQPAALRSDLAYMYQTSAWGASAQQRVYRRAPSVPDQGSFHPTMVNSFGFAKLVTSLALLKGNYRGSARL